MLRLWRPLLVPSDVDEVAWLVGACERLIGDDEASHVEFVPRIVLHAPIARDVARRARAHDIERVHSARQPASTCWPLTAVPGQVRGTLVGRGEGAAGEALVVRSLVARAAL